MTQDRDPLMTDEAVSETYRKLATERAPATLDARILAAARAEARTRYGLLRMRTRPLAWAAMIGLSLVIVLQFARLPGRDDALPSEVPASAVRDEFPSRRQLSITEEAPAAAESPEALQAPTATPAEVSPGSAAAVMAKPGRAEAEKADVPENDAVAPDQRQDATGSTPAAAFAPGPSKALAPQSPEREAAFSAIAASACGESARAEPESWLRCIDALRDAGEMDLADAEFEKLRAAFPDFPVEDRHK